MGILRADRITGLGGANAIKGSVMFTSGGALDIDLDGTSIGTSNFTIEAWVFWFGNASHQFTGSSSNNFNFYIADDDGDLKFYDGSNTFDLDASPVRANEWTHVAFVREGTSTSQTKVYVNGVNTQSVTLATDFSFARLLSGINYLDGSRGYGNGYTSNLRVTLDAVYTSAFTPPSSELTVLDNTIVLCCQSPGNILQEATGKTIVPFKHGVNQGDAVASHFTPNSPVGFSTTTDVGSQYGATFDGFTVFATSTYMVPPGGNTRERNRGRGIFADGDQSKTIEFINIQSLGNAVDFGDSTTDFKQRGSVSSSTRTATAGGFNNPAFTDIIDFITIATTSNATDFGNLTLARRGVGGAGNGIRGVFYGGTNPSLTDTIDFITIASTGNATDFGNASSANASVGALASPTRAVFGGGADNRIEYITIASEGNTTDFGDLASGNTEQPAGTSSSTRGLFICGESQPSGAKLNTIQFITIATTGNTTDFGDNTFTVRSLAACNNSLRAVYGGGNLAPDSSTTNALSYVTIATTGNGSDFGDLIGARNLDSSVGSSDSHGGIS